MWLPLPPEPPDVPAEFSAAALSVEAQVVEAHELRLTAPPWHWRAGRLHRGPTATCPETWSLTAVEASSLDVRLAADALEACPGRDWKATGLRLDATALHLEAETASWSAPGAFTAEGVRLSTCGCDDPPWSVETSRLEVTGDLACASWPVLRLGVVPVLVAPRWAFPLAPRRFGLLAPELGWRGDDGPAALQPLFVPLGDEADLTPAVGWAAGAGPQGRLVARWHESARHRGALTVAADSRGAAGHGDGTLGGEAAGLALEGRVATTAEIYAAHARAPEAAFAPYVTGRLGLAAADPSLAVSTRIATVSDRRAGYRSTLPAARLGLSSGGEHVRLDADVAVVAERSSAGSAPDQHELGTRVAGSGGHHLGPVRLAARVAAETRTTQTAAAQGSVVGGMATTSAGLAFRRPGQRGSHTVDVSIHGVAAEAGVTGDPDRPAPVAPSPVDRRGGFAVVAQRLSYGDAVAGLEVAWGRFVAEHDARGAAAGRPWATASFDHPWATLEAAWDGADGLAATAAAGPGPFRLTAAYLRTGPDGLAPLLFSRVPDRTQRLASEAVEMQTIRPGVAVAVGPIDAQWEAFVDAADGRWLGHAGTARFAGRCQCWQAGVRVEQASPAPMPDAWFTLALTGIE